MAMYHLSVKVISRAAGSSALAAAAYRSASRLYDQRLDRAHDFTNKSGVVHSEIMLPDNAPPEWSDRERLWNEVEAFEKRKDAQLSREVEFAIPREMNQTQGIDLARDFVQREFVDQGMVADLNVHWDIGADGQARIQDRETIMEAARTLAQATRNIQDQVAKAREAGMQNRLLRRVGLGAVSVGVVAGLLIAIGLLHLIPEHGAAWILGLGRWEAGERLMASADPRAWNEIEGIALTRDQLRPLLTAQKKLSAERKGKARRR